MLCALTVRELKPGTFEDFREAFLADFEEDHEPSGWVRFDMLRNTEAPDEVICFGFFDGTLEELRATAAEGGYEEQQQRIVPYVKAVGTDGIFEVVEDRAAV